MRDRRRKPDEPFNPFAANANTVRTKKRNESVESDASNRNDNGHSQSSNPDFDKSDFDKSSPAPENGLGDLLARKKSEHSANVEQERLRKERERQRELREEQERQRLLQQKIEPYKARLMSDVMDEISKIDPINLTKPGKRNLNTHAFAKESDPSEFLVYVRNKGLMRSDNFFRMASGKEDFDTQENDHVLLFESNAPRSAKELCFQSGNGMLLTAEGAFGVQWVDFDDFSTSELKKLRSKSEIMDVDYIHDDDEMGHLVVARKDGFKVIHTLGSGSRNVLSSAAKQSSMTFFSPNGWHVAFAGGSPEISIYNVITHRKSHEIYTGYGLISARLSDHSEVLFATFSSGKMIVIEVQTGAIIDEFEFATSNNLIEWARGYERLWDESGY